MTDERLNQANELRQQIRVLEDKLLEAKNFVDYLQSDNIISVSLQIVTPDSPNKYFMLDCRDDVLEMGYGIRHKIKRELDKAKEEYDLL